jgi:hypothetical protein
MEYVTIPTPLYDCHATHNIIFILYSNCELTWDNYKDNSLYKLSIKLTYDYVELNNGVRLLVDG